MRRGEGEEEGEWKDSEMRLERREERGGNAKRAKTEIELAGGKLRQVVCGGVCVNESAGGQSTRCGDERVKERNTERRLTD